MPSPTRGVSAAPLRCNGRYILFDCGEGTQVALRREKVSPIKIDLIALTHYHGDHIFGLPGLLQTMNCLKRIEPLYIMGPDGLEEAMQPILQMAGPLDYEVRFVKFDKPNGMAMHSLQTKWPETAWIHHFSTVHRVPSQGYLFYLHRQPKFLPEKAREAGIPVSMWKQIATDNPALPIKVDGAILCVNGRPLHGSDFLGEHRKGLQVVFSGDTEPCAQLHRAALNADLLIHDATYGEDQQVDEAELWGHSTFRQAAEMALRSEVGELWLTHFSQSIQDPTEYLPNAQAVFPNTVCGYDGLTKTLSFRD